MHTICTARGTIEFVEDENGQPARDPWPRPVEVRLRYELKPSPRQPLHVDITGRHLFSLGAIEKLTLDNGVILTGRTFVVGLLDPNGISRQRMTDVQETGIRLSPDDVEEAPPEIDSAVLGVVSSEPLAHGACTTGGWARAGRPFLFIEGPLPEERATRETRWIGLSTLRMFHRSFEMCFSPTSAYWRNLVDTRMLSHDSIVGIRKTSHSVITWPEFHQLVELLEAFMGWVNHCVAPVFHIKAYRRGRLVYRGYKLQPHATGRRDRYSWLPKYGPNGTSALHGDMVTHALGVFADRWELNRDDRGVFHIALQLLRSREKGAPGSRPSILYLRDAFGAISILTSMLVGPNRSRGRHQTMIECLRHLNVTDRIPDREGRRFLSEHHEELWSAANPALSQELAQERVRGTLCRPLANVQNWLLHVDDPQNADRLLGLGRRSQGYFVQVAIWLADLMVMKVVGYEGTYLNRLSGNVEAVPWVDECKWDR